MNLLQEYGYSKEDIERKKETVYQELFAKKTSSYRQAIDGCYVLEKEGDVSSFACGLALMILVQLGKKQEFDALLQWMDEYMLISTSDYMGLYVSSCDTDGVAKDESPDVLSLQYIALSLIFASHRFCNGEYGEEALTILRALLHSKKDLWNVNSHLVETCKKGETFITLAQNAPQFLSLFSMFCDPRDADFWNMAASESLKLLTLASHKKTGLIPQNMNRDFSFPPCSKGGTFYSSSYIASFNIATYSLWLGDLPSLAETAQKQMNFFSMLKMDDFWEYKLDGTKARKKARQPLSLCAVIASLAVTLERRRQEAKKQERQVALLSVKRFWDAPLEKGKQRHIDNLLYMLCLLSLSGDYRVW